MYNVTAEYLAALKRSARFEHVRGMIGDAIFTDANVISMNYTNRCSDTSDVSFGSAYIGQIDAVFTDVNITRGSWRGLQISIEAGLQLADDTTEYIPIGVFTIQSAEWSDFGIRIIANDAVIAFDKPFGGTQTQAGYIYDFAAWACLNCNVPFGMTRADTEQLPNGTELLGFYPENDVKTWRDFMAWIAQTVGGFITTNRSGEIIIRSFANTTPIDSWSASDRIAGSVFADYSTLYAGISIVNIEDQTLQFYGADDGAAINLGQNPLLQFGLEEIRTRQRMAIASVAQGIRYTPFKTSILSTAVYDLGDVIECDGGIAGDDPIQCCIMAIDWNLKQTTAVQGFGADPALATGKSKTDKNLQGLLSKTQSDQITYYQFKNLEEIAIGENVETEIANIIFAAKNPTEVDVWVEAKIDLINVSVPENIDVYHEEDDPETPEPDPVIVPIGWWIKDHQENMIGVVRYYYDGILLDYSPIETWTEDGYHTIHYGYFIPNVDNLKAHTFRTTIELANGIGEIAINDATMVLRGQSLVGDDIDTGKIYVSDETGLYEITELEPIDIEDGAPVIQVNDPESPDPDLLLHDIQITESITLPEIEPIQEAPIDASVTVIIENVVFGLMSEDGHDAILSADENFVITSED